MGEQRPTPPEFTQQEMQGIENIYRPRDLYTHYYIDKHITKTTMSDVYRGTAKEGGASVALKFFIYQSDGGDSRNVLDERTEEDRKQRIIQELTASYLMQFDSPYVLQPIDVVIDKQLGIGLAIPWAEGGELIQRLEREERIYQWNLVVSCGIQIALGLAAMHDKGIVLRDLSPKNIFMLDKEDVALPRCAIGDFGIAAPHTYLQKTKQPGSASSIGGPLTAVHSIKPEDIWEGTRITPLGTTMLTPTYAAPEQMRTDDPISYSADLYALGIILFEITTGEKCFTGTNMQNIYNRKQILQLSIPDEHANIRVQQTMNLIRSLTVATVLERLKKATPEAVQEAAQEAIPESTQEATPEKSAQWVAHRLATIWSGLGLAVEHTPWFREALDIKTS